jgi:hypothetical protein
MFPLGTMQTLSGDFPDVIDDETVIPGCGSLCILLRMLTFLIAQPVRCKIYNDDMTIYPMKENLTVKAANSVKTRGLYESDLQGTEACESA